ncbi:hypothetical protein BDW22DRAFT_983491 [Trametopsis cervina]|nr:hypothetical protein BDW22DRAFT_983491 [Trametopsis cervina]
MMANLLTATQSRNSPGLRILHVEPHERQPENDLSLETRLNRLRISEALMARDHAVHQMEALCASNRSKESTISQLQHEKMELEVKLASSEKQVPGILKVDANQDRHEVEEKYRKLEKENLYLKSKIDLLLWRTDVPDSPRHELTPLANASPFPEDELRSPPIDVHSPLFSSPPEFAFPQESDAVTQARFAVLAELPIPPEIPSDMLVPFVIPTPHTLQDFLGTASGSLKSQLSNFRIFQEATTFWCPDREEHGYYVTPVFKCNTNPRVPTAHRWTSVDLSISTDCSTGIVLLFIPLVLVFTAPGFVECFYTKDGKWYYAGVYRTFRLRNLTPQEWAKLPMETTQAIVKDTLSHRKSTSPQNVYETGQLYAAGALKAACIGLQCIGFNEDLYNGLLALAHNCAKTGRWRAPAGGLGTGPIWSPSASPNLGYDIARQSSYGTGSKELDGDNVNVSPEI